MGIFILIMVISSAGHVSGTSAINSSEFNSQKACVAARDWFNKQGDYASAECFPKSSIDN